MIKVLLVAPYTGLAEIAKKTSLPEGFELNIVIANLEEGVKEAQEAERNGYDLIISRGGTAKLIEKSVSVPVVHIDISGYDILRVFTLIGKMDKNVALVGFENISRGAATLCSILEFDVRLITINSGDEVRDHLVQLKQEGFDVVLGDVITVQVAEQLGIRGVLITSGKEALLDAYERASRIMQLMRKMDRQLYFLQHTVKALPYPMVIVDRDLKEMCRTDAYDETGIELLDEHPAVIRKLVNAVLENGQMKWVNMVSEENCYGVEAFLADRKKRAVGITIHTAIEKTASRAFFVESDVRHQPIIGESRQTEEIRQSLPRYADAGGSVCIIGEPGTGRTMVAHAIHFNKYGQAAPIITVEGDRLTLTEILELHAKLSVIKKGSLILRNAERVQLEEQEKLGELLMQLPADIRVIAIMGEPLDYLLEDGGSLDRNFYKAISYLPLHLSPLRERKEDIPSLVNYFLSEFHTEEGNETLGMKKDAMEYLLQQDWKGNISQLRRVVRELSIKATGYYVELDQVTNLFGNMDRQVSGKQPAIRVTGTLKEMERQIIHQVLQEENDNQTKAAQRLGINRSTLWRKLNESAE